MNKDLANILKSKLGNLSFIDKLAGLVQTIERSVELGDGNSLIYRFPVSTDITWSDCTESQERDLMPDSTVKGILYFEDNGTKYLGGSRNNEWESKLRLVCWLNLDKITGTTDSITTQAIAIILGKMNQIFNSEPFTKITVTPTNIPVRDKSIFGKYTYDERALQYLMSPFDFFAIDLQITYSIPSSCVQDITLNPKLC